MENAKAKATAFAGKAADMAGAQMTALANSEAAQKMKAAAKEKTKEALAKMGMTEDDLKKLDRIPLIVGVLGLVTFFVLLSTQFSLTWAKGVALYEGEPVDVYVQLGTVMFGTEGTLTSKMDMYHGADTPPGTHISLGKLCETVVAADSFELSGNPKTTPQSVWCDLRNAGIAVTVYSSIGDIIALAAPIATLMFAAKEIPCVGTIFSKIDPIFPAFYQKIAVVASWLALWGFLLFAMLNYAYLIPDSLGVGPLEFEFSFGMLRMCFLLVSILAAMIGIHFSQAYSAENTAEAWTEFVETRCCSAKKALYLLLLFQLMLYLLLGIYSIRWEMLLVFFCFYYVDAKKDNFKLMYIVLTSATILLDVIEILAIPASDVESLEKAMGSMSKGQMFSRSVFVLIFFTKFLVLGTLYLYGKEDHPDGFTELEDGDAQYDQPRPVAGLEDEIAE